MKKIEEIRKDIDLIDDKIFGLLRKRLKLVISTIEARDKAEDLAREEEILNRIVAMSENEYEDRYIGSIYMTAFVEGKRIKKIIKEKNEENH